MAGCQKIINVSVPRGMYDYKMIQLKCGSTSPYGAPWLCGNCEEKYKNVNWRREAILNGETWGEEDY